MPPIQFDNRVSWMDVIAIVGIAGSALYGYFGYGEGIRDNQSDIDYIKRDVVRIEEKVNHQGQAITEKLEKMGAEQKADNLRIESKIDRLIERELNARQR